MRIKKISHLMVAYVALYKTRTFSGYLMAAWTVQEKQSALQDWLLLNPPGISETEGDQREGFIVTINIKIPGWWRGKGFDEF